MSQNTFKLKVNLMNGYYSATVQIVHVYMDCTMIARFVRYEYLVFFFSENLFLTISIFQYYVCNNFSNDEACHASQTELFCQLYKVLQYQFFVAKTFIKITANSSKLIHVNCNFMNLFKPSDYTLVRSHCNTLFNLFEF